MMYNEEQKLRFLDNCGREESTIGNIDALFHTVSKVELSNNKDLCDFNQSEVMDLLKRANSKSRESLTTTCKSFEYYYDWCFKNGIVSDVNNKYAPYNTATIIKTLIPDEMVTDKYYSAKMFKSKIIPKIPDVINRYIMYSIFLGIFGKKFEEIRNIKPEDLNRETKEVNLITGRKVKVDTLWIGLMESANEEDMFKLSEYEGEYKREDLKMYEKNSPYVLKRTVRGGGDCIPYYTTLRRFNIITKQTENEFIVPKNIYFNGMINYIKERYAEKGISIESALLEKNNDGVYRDEETQKYIYEFGANNFVRLVRKSIKPHIKNYMD